MREQSALALALFPLLATAGCLVGHSYLGPEAADVSFEDLHGPPAPRPLRVDVTCIDEVWNGRHCTGIADAVNGIIIKSGLASKILRAENIDQLIVELHVRELVDPLYMPVHAVLKAITVGTLGVIGFAMPTEDWLINATYISPGKPVVQREYRESTYDLIGIIAVIPPPDGAKEVAVSPDRATWEQAAEKAAVTDLVLRLLRDLQQSGEL